MSNYSQEAAKQEIYKAINFLSQNKFAEAESICKDLLLDHENSDAYHILSSLKLKDKEFDSSIELVNKAISIDSSNIGYYVTLGCAQSSIEKYADAAETFKDAIEINNKVSQVHFYLGEAYRKLTKYNLAIKAFKKSIEINKDHSSALLFLGISYVEIKEFELAKNAFKKCIDTNPDFIEAHINLAMLHLLTGNYKDGWEEFEWRLKLKAFENDISGKPWNGESLSNKKLLIIDEQGFGDTINFIRFAQDFHKDDCEVILQTKPELAELMNQQKWINHVTTQKYDGEYDYFIHLLSIMKIIDWSPDNHKNNFPYLTYESSHTECIKNHKINIGLVLQTSLSNDHNHRSIPYEMLKECFDSSKHNVISLDYKENQNEYINDIFDCKADYKDFNELASIIDNLDLVISVDTAVAHLSGALNKNTWLLLPYVPGWRWDLNFIDSTPWYNSLILFRQDQISNWDNVINTIKLELMNYE